MTAARTKIKTIRLPFRIFCLFSIFSPSFASPFSILPYCMAKPTIIVVFIGRQHIQTYNIQWLERVLFQDCVIIVWKRLFVVCMYVSSRNRRSIRQMNCTLLLSCLLLITSRRAANDRPYGASAAELPAYSRWPASRSICCLMSQSFWLRST